MKEILPCGIRDQFHGNHPDIPPVMTVIAADQPVALLILRCGQDGWDEIKLHKDLDCDVLSMSECEVIRLRTEAIVRLGGVGWRAYNLPPVIHLQL